MKDLSKLRIISFLLLLTFISSIDPNRYDNYHLNHRNKTHSAYDHNGNTDYYYYNHYYNDYNNWNNNGSCPAWVIVAGALLSLWSSLFVLYFIVNRRKKTFTAIINKDVQNLPGYINV